MKRLLPGLVLLTALSLIFSCLIYGTTAVHGAELSTKAPVPNQLSTLSDSIQAARPHASPPFVITRHRQAAQFVITKFSHAPVFVINEHKPAAPADACPNGQCPLPDGAATGGPCKACPAGTCGAGCAGGSCQGGSSCAGRGVSRNGFFARRANGDGWHPLRNGVARRQSRRAARGGGLGSRLFGRGGCASCG